MEHTVVPPIRPKTHLLDYACKQRRDGFDGNSLPERTKLVSGSGKAFPQNFEAAGQPSANPGRWWILGRLNCRKPAQQFNLRGRFLGEGRQSLRSLERSEAAGRQGRNGAQESEVFAGW
jgi:hypothetical protein